MECPPGAWQNLPGSRLLNALNDPVETFPGISYSQIYTDYDELSTPAGAHGTSPLHTGSGDISNVTLQQVCPASVAEHILIGSIDPVGWGLVIDALEHPGPARASRVDKRVCSQVALPGVDATKASKVLSGMPYLLAGATAINLPGVAKVREEPALRCYVFAACADEVPRLAARFAGTFARRSLLITAVQAPAGAGVRAISVRLPAGASLTSRARREVTIRRAGKRARFVLEAIRGGFEVELARGAGVLSIRLKVGALALGRGLRRRLATGQRVVLGADTEDDDGRTSTVSVRIGRSPSNRNRG